MEDYFWFFGGILAFIAAVVGIIFGVICLIVIPLGVHYGKVNCTHWSNAAHLPTKFVRYSYWSWDCFTTDPNKPSVWIPIGQVRSIH